jgi:hypothetical protein
MPKSRHLFIIKTFCIELNLHPRHQCCPQFFYNDMLKIAEVTLRRNFCYIFDPNSKIYNTNSEFCNARVIFPECEEYGIFYSFFFT